MTITQILLIILLLMLLAGVRYLPKIISTFWAKIRK